MSKDHTTILQNRYNHLLKPIANVDHVVKTLCDRGIIDMEEKCDILRTLAEEGRKHSLCRLLTGKGISSLVQVSEVLTLEQERESLETRRCSNVTDTTTTTSTSSASSSEGESVSEGCLDEEKVVYSEEKSSEAPACGDVWSSRMQLETGRLKESHQQQQGSCAHLDTPTNSKHITTDVPDPPMELFEGCVTPSRHAESACRMEDAFIVLFFTLITQQLQQLLSSKRQKDGAPPHHDQATPFSGASRLDPQADSTFPWLHLDVSSEDARDFFPAEVVRGIVPSSANPAPLKMSVILESFQQFVRAIEVSKQENQTLLRKARAHDDLLRKYRALETKFAQTRTIPHNTTPPSDKTMPTHSSAKAVEPAFRERDDHHQVVEALRQAHERSEVRCKQLVGVTQQWALECEEKVKVIQVLEKEVEQLKGDIQQLEVRVARYKKFWMDNKDTPRGRVGGESSQFEELRGELVMRRELYDQVLAQRDEEAEKVKVLLSEIESLKDHNVQLMDRAANFKVQAQAKEPSVREMSNLLEQKGRLEREVEKLRRRDAELSDKTVALEILVKDLTEKINHLQGTPKPLPHPGKRNDAMVTGYSGRTCRPPHIDPSHSSPRSPHGSQFMAPPNNNRRRYSRDDDVLSLESSESGSGNFSSHESASSDKRQPFTRSNTLHGMGSPTQKPPQLKTRNPLPVDLPPPPQYDIQFRSRDLPLGSHDSEVAPPPGDDGDGDDYTRQIRYPNNSRILVPPLLDEDISLKGGSAGDQILPGPLKAKGPPARSGESAPSKEPYYCDRSYFRQPSAPEPRRGQGNPSSPPNQPTAVLSPNSAFLASGTTERKCPTCQHAFLTLSEVEFQSHVAVCYR